MTAQPKYDPETRIFENDLLESMTRTNPIWPAVFWVPVTLASLAYALSLGVPWYTTAGLFAVGVLFWTFVEYLLHRWVFHFIPKTRAVRRFYYLVHQVHHDAQEYDRLTMPIALALIIAAPILLAQYFILGPTLMWACFPGVVVGYLAYDYVHLYSHFGKPKSRIMKGVRRRHQQHHHAYPDRWFGVSSPLWDYVFRTHVRPGERPTANAHDHDHEIDWGRPDFTQTATAE